MNTIVFILMIWNGYAWVPGLSFNEPKKCEVAAVLMNKQVAAVMSSMTPKPLPAWCIRIEK